GAAKPRQSVLGQLNSVLPMPSAGLAPSAGADLLLNPAADIGIDRLPVIERPLQHRRADAAEQAARDLINERLTFSIIEDLPHQNAGLGEIVILRMQAIGAPHHLTVRFPAIRDR